MLPMKRSAMALARGARTGVLMMRMSVAVKTASNAVVNLASRSRIRNRNWREALAGVYEQLGYGAENATWRNFYLTGALELAAE